MDWWNDLMQWIQKPVSNGFFLVVSLALVFEIRALVSRVLDGIAKLLARM